MGEDLFILPPRDSGGIALIGTAVSDAIDRLLDDAISRCPEAASERELLRNDLLYKVHELGFIPERVDLVPPPATTNTEAAL